MARRSPREQTSTWQMTVFGALVLLLAFTSGCTGDDPRDLPNDRTWESAHFRYHTRSSDEGPCEAVLAQLERHFAAMQAYLGFPWPAERKVDYYKFLDHLDYANHAGCPGETLGCAYGSAVFSDRTMHEHELIHAYVAPLGGPPSFFAEGIAEVLACDNPFDRRFGNDPWQDAVALPPTDPLGVLEQGPWFVGQLLHRHGPERFVALYDRLDDELASAPQIAATFESVYGETLEAAWNAALASGDHVRCAGDWSCDNGAPLPLDGSRQPVAQACDGSDNALTFQLGAQTDLVMSFQGYDATFAPANCDQDLPGVTGNGDDGVAWHNSLAAAAPGKYFIRTYDSKSPSAVGIRAAPTRVYAQDCTQVEAVDLTTEEFEGEDLDLTIPNDGRSWFVKLHLPSDRRFWWSPAVRPEVASCLGCEDGAECQPFRADAPRDAEGNVTLRLTGLTTDAGYSKYTFGFK